MKVEKVLLLSAIFGGLAFSAPQIRIFPSSSYDFRVVTIDSQSETEFAITNVGDAVLRICSVNIDSGFPDFQLVNNNCDSTSLNYAQDCRFKVRFSPRFKQNYSGTVNVAYDDDGDGLICNTQKTYTLQLTGSGTALRVVKVEPLPLERGFGFDFPATDYYQQRSMTIRICNASGDPLRFSDLALILSPDSPDYSSFSITASTCNSATLQYATDNEDCSKNFCQFTVSFSPQAGIGGSEKELYYGYIRVNDLNGGPDGEPSNATIYVNGRSQVGSYIYVPVGSETQEAVRVTFTCPDDPNPYDPIRGPTEFQIGQPSVTGTYFSLVSYSCPNTCIENAPVDCTAIVKFAPQTPGVFPGSVIIPVIGAEPVGRSFLGLTGSLTGNYIYVNPNYIDLGAVRRLNTYAQTLIIRNTSGSELEFNVSTAGIGLTLKSINCTCNTGYVGSPTGICVPNYTIVPPPAPPTEPISNRAYRLRPSEVCSAVVEFTPPIVSSMNSFNGAVIIDTQAQVVTVPLSARMDVPPLPVSQPAPSIGSGGGGGCSTGGANLLWLSLLPILALVRRFIRR